MNLGKHVATFGGGATAAAAVAGLVGAIGGTFSGIKTQLARGVRSASLYVVADSTGITSPALLTRWPAQFVQQLAATTPAFNIRLADYDYDADYWRAERLMYTAPGGVRALRLYGQGVGNSVCPWRAPTGAIATDFAVQMRIKFEAIPTTYRWLAGRYTNPNTDWVFRLETNGHLRLQNASAGGYYLESSVAAPIVAGQAIWLGFYYAAATGVVSFWTSTAETALLFHEPNAGWTQLGSNQTDAEHLLSTELNYGWIIGGPNLSPNCTVYNMRAYTVNGATVRPVFVDDVDHWGAWGSAASHDDPTDGVAWNWVGAPSLTVRNAAIGGVTYAYHTDNSDALFLDPEASLIILAAGLNDPEGVSESALLDALLVKTVAACPRAGYALMTQNPSETYIENTSAAAGFNSDHVRRIGLQVEDAIAYALRAGWKIIDTYRTIAALPAPRTNDGVHPTDATAAVQGAQVVAAFANS